METMCDTWLRLHCSGNPVGTPQIDATSGLFERHGHEAAKCVGDGREGNRDFLCCILCVERQHPDDD